MSGSFYSKFVFPYLCELTMSVKSLRGFRQDALQEINGEVLEIGFGTGLNLPHFPEWHINYQLLNMTGIVLVK